MVRIKVAVTGLAMLKVKYDVAISFLSADESIAAALHNRLSESLQVFFYPRNQEELAGTNGTIIRQVSRSR
jgi:hypothetical protein